MISRRVFGKVLTLAIALSSSGAGIALAQDYPNQPIKMVVPFAAGGSTDTLARQLSDDLSRVLGQPVIVENRAGAGGVIGRTHVATSPADGYTLLFAENTLPIGQALYQNTKSEFVSIDQFQAIAGVATSPSALVMANKVPVNSLAELVEYSKKFPQKLSNATVGVGSVSHLSFEVLKAMTGLDSVAVPYKGGGQALTDVIAGHVDIAMSSAQTVRGMLESQQLKVLAITGDGRLPSMPDVPTLAEAGVGAPSVDMSFWFGIFAPKDLPEAVRAKLEEAVSQILSDDAVKEKLTRSDIHPSFLSAAAMQEKVESEVANWSKFIQDNNIKAAE